VTQLADPPKTLEALARERVLEDILSGALPPRARLKIRELSARYDIGASPLREALSRLVSDGLVTVESNKGFRVAPLSLRELCDITEMREILEAEAFRRAVRRGDEEWESSVVAAFHRLSRAVERYDPRDDKTRLDWEAHHHAFHRQLVAGCANPRLTAAVERLYRHLMRYRTILRLTEIGAERLRVIHEELMQVALDRDEEAAGPMMRRHVKVNLDQVRAGLAADPELGRLIEPDIAEDGAQGPEGGTAANRH
jgi:DNA-binding GntR family transcriptional regulator